VNKRGPKIFLVLAVLFGSLLAASVLAVFYALVIEPNLVVVTEVGIDHPRLAAALGNKVVVQISDLHLEGRLGFRERRLIRKLNRLQPEIILVTGDLVEETLADKLVAEFFALLKPNLWSYGVLGNSDAFYLKGDAHLIAWRQAGLSMIGGQALRMNLIAGEGNSFWLAGIDYPRSADRLPGEEIQEVLSQIAPPGREPVIFLSPDPQLAPLLIENGADLVLSGDTHGGQVSFPGWRRIFRKLGRSPFVRGLYQISGGWLYVNRGIGTKHVPVRFLCPPEITVFRFHG